MLTAALELLPDRLANVAILPLQLRLVYEIGQRHGQQLDANQVKDLAGTFGLGAAAQVVEGLVRKVLGGVASGLLGGLLGGATGLAAGAAVTFAATYALGHAAEQYYAQGRKLSAEDLRALFTRFQGEAQALLPQVAGADPVAGPAGPAARRAGADPRLSPIAARSCARASAGRWRSPAGVRSPR